MSTDPVDLSDQPAQAGCAMIVACLCIAFGLFVVLFMGLHELMDISRRTASPWTADRSLFLWQQVDVLFTMFLATGSIIGGLLFLRRPGRGRIVLVAYAAVGIAWTIAACVIDVHFIEGMQQLQPELPHHPWSLLVPTTLAVLWRAAVLAVMQGTEIGRMEPQINADERR